MFNTVYSLSKPLVQSGQVGATPVEIDLLQHRPPFRITLIPGAGNTSLCEIKHAGAWFAWPYGQITSPATDILHGPVEAVRFTRVSGVSMDTYGVMA